MERLKLSQRWLEDIDIEHIIRVRSLRSLDLSWNEHVTVKGARLRATMPHLETLDLTPTSIDSEGIAHFGKLRNLKRLKCNDVDDQALAALARCRKLEVLDFSNAEISEKGARAVALVPQLKELSMGWAKLSPNAQPHLRHFTGSKVLDISNVRLTDAGFEAITTLPALEELRLGVFDDTGLPSQAAISKLGNMKALRWVSGGGDDHFLEAVSRCKTVEVIRVSRRDDVTDAGIAHLVRCPALRELDLADTAVTDAGLAHLARCPALRKLVLADTAITDVCIPSLI